MKQKKYICACKKCGEMFRCFYWNNRGKNSIVWRCTSRLELQKDLVKKENNKEAYDEIADKLFEIREERQLASLDTALRDEQLNRITELQDFIKKQGTYLKEFDETLVRR